MAAVGAVVAACYNRAVNYEEAVAYMSGRLQWGMRLGRDRLRALLARVDNPHERLRCVHVAGTNGKGSTTVFVASILRAAGYNVGAYLSPYVFDLRERVQINGRLIPKADFARWVTTLRPHIEAIARDPHLGETTEFELKTAVAFCYFAEQAVDFAVIEVGIGGRLDSTNVIPPPLAAVITHIGLDHTSILGDTLGKIAGEKAGIIKPGTGACITAVPPGEALDVITQKAKQENVSLRRVGPAASGDPHLYATFAATRPEAGGVDVFLPTGGADLAGLRLALRGPFQAANAAAAAVAVHGLVESGAASRVTPGALRSGLETAALPARFQIVQDGANNGPALVLDGAHNEDGARVLVQALRATFSGRRITFVLGSRDNHDPAPFLGIIAPLVARVVATAPPFKPRPAGAVAEAAARFGLPVSIVEPASRAIAETFARAGDGEVVVVTGSFYTVGETPPHLRGRWAAEAE